MIYTLQRKMIIVIYSARPIYLVHNCTQGLYVHMEFRFSRKIKTCLRTFACMFKWFVFEFFILNRFYANGRHILSAGQDRAFRLFSVIQVYDLLPICHCTSDFILLYVIFRIFISMKCKAVTLLEKGLASENPYC